MLTATRLYKAFSGQSVLQNVSLALHPGQLVALVGVSGSGKSTLLNLLAGLLDADRGEVRLHGQPVAGPANTLVAGHPQIRLVHQEFQLLPNISLRENIDYALRAYDPAYREARVNYLLRLCRLEAVQHHKPRQASGGEKQRTALAAALAQPADVLLLDEPFSHLDLLNKLLFREVLLALVRQANQPAPPPACLFVTHDATDALSVADQIGVLDRGKLSPLVMPRDLYANPGSVLAARLTGSVAVFRGRHLPALGLSPAPTPNALHGLRPEHVWLGPNAPLEGRVTGVFFQGARTELAITLNRYLTLFAYTSRADVQPGDQVRIGIDPAGLMTL